MSRRILLWSYMGKSQFPNTFNWQTTSPVVGFLPNSSTSGNSIPSGVTSGAMSGTNTIYTNIIGLRQSDNNGVQVDWTGTPTGSITYWVSTNGSTFHALTNSSLPNPSGSAAGYCYALQNLPFQYIFIQYTNSSGSGTITASSQNKANNS
jgi:hypothetical protein